MNQVEDNRLVDTCGPVSAYAGMGRPDEISPEVAAAFDKMPDASRAVLMSVRELIFVMAEERGVGDLTETLKWGEPAYLTEASKAGSTVRLGMNKQRPAVFFNCQTTLVDSFRADFTDVFEYVGNRAVLLSEDFDRDALAICLARALTYHRDKRVAHA